MAARQLARSPLAVQGVPVFMYHGLCHGAPADRYTSPLSFFRGHLAFLREQMIAVLDLAAINDAPERGCVLTFDDGLASHYELALPELAARQMTATFFVVTSLVGAAGYVTWPQLREMRDAGMTIGSHGERHIAYTELSSTAAESELRRSRCTLEDQLGCAAQTFSAPFGFINAAVAEAARRAGFSTVCNSLPWTASATDAEIPRLAIYSDTGQAEFAALALRSALPLVARRARHALLHWPKQIRMHSRMRRMGVTAGEGAR